mmetsp:Transcript_34610/g.99712  ORF Transcript_34610/g.99712 Transcript_34610/m.99712 type:complete len:201 (+) Transcript_34610:177-779(+)|eukprot:CAMPEP_0176048248 /NCGR_PEP_ID=MMETSP0120_2-20121206/23965_1 /TAXON_ID=160619 /ORGANISM="Kryptoperidinium foliaceum, Strain CCMP 1326" /LENGTH=200 /DNA_ID=CAMNT_0017381663 /DNA_START=160 /DNA_END=762 /DNA_ORIENTATION=-
MTSQVSNALFQAAQQIEGSGISAGEKRKELPIAPAQTVSPATLPGEASTFVPAAKKQATSRSKALRLEQNRKAARESRRRKKAMIEELQRSLMFFSRTNEQLKHENEILTRQLHDAQSKLTSMGKPLPSADASTTKPEITVEKNQSEAQAPVEYDEGLMQPGATMQAMASFQQAAQAAMEAASRNMRAQPAATSDETKNA